jgi:hypothetical protein
MDVLLKIALASGTNVSFASMSGGRPLQVGYRIRVARHEVDKKKLSMPLPLHISQTSDARRRRYGRKAYPPSHWPIHIHTTR